MFPKGDFKVECGVLTGLSAAVMVPPVSVHLSSAQTSSPLIEFGFSGSSTADGDSS